MTILHRIQPILLLKLPALLLVLLTSACLVGCQSGFGVSTLKRSEDMPELAMSPAA